MFQLTKHKNLTTSNLHPKPTTNPKHL